MSFKSDQLEILFSVCLKLFKKQSIPLSARRVAEKIKCMVNFQYAFLASWSWKVLAINYSSRHIPLFANKKDLVTIELY